MSYRRFAGYSAIAVSIALAPILLWKLADILLLAFGGIMIASLLRLLAEPIRSWTRLPAPLCLLISAVFVVGAFALVLWRFGSHVSGELNETLARGQSAISLLATRLQSNEVGRFVLSHASDQRVSLTSWAERFFTLGMSIFEALILVVISAAFVAVQPASYREGTLLLFPRDQRPRVREAFKVMASGLRLWLLGQLISMAVVGLLSGSAAWLIGLHTAAALGLIAAMAEFIPYIGPIMAAIPALLVAFTQGTDFVLWTAGAYALIHLVEGNLLMPIVQRWVVSAPPALMLIGIAAASSLFGIYGVIFASPLVIVIMMGVKSLYIQDVLGEDVETPDTSRPPIEDQ